MTIVFLTTGGFIQVEQTPDEIMSMLEAMGDSLDGKFLKLTDKVNNLIIIAAKQFVGCMKPQEKDPADLPLIKGK